MGDLINPVDGNSFVELVETKDSIIFVDKTDFILKTNALISTNRKLLAMTRPRRFGKTVTADMLLAYYSKEYDGHKIFNNLKISKDQCFENHLNKYDVIYIDMNSIRNDYIAYTKDEDLQIKGITTIVDYLQYSVIEELKENKDYATLFSKSRKAGKKNLSAALREVCKFTREKFILIMDEWDLVFRDYQSDTELQEAFIDFLRGLFKTKDGQACFALAYLTGILPIKKYNSQSALNNFDEYNMLTPGDFASYFGFTEEEVNGIVSSRSCEVTRSELKSWYEGYKIKNIDIYNPNSVCKAVSRNECISYWSGTSSNEEVVRLINMNFKGIRNDIIKLIEGKNISFTCRNFQNDMISIKSRNDVFSLLVCLGYLGCSDSTNQYNKNAYVPNTEIRFVLMDIIREQSWFNRMKSVKRSEKLLQAIRKLDGDSAAAIIQEIHNSREVSLLAYNNEESLTYCVMTGLMWATLDDYSCHREEQSGKGRVDLVYIPDNIDNPLIIIEFKYDTSAEEALSQIKSREYFKAYIAEYHNIIMVGINYSTQTKEHQCLIEKLN